jgi:hypothetical protein
MFRLSHTASLLNPLPLYLLPLLRRSVAGVCIVLLSSDKSVVINRERQILPYTPLYSITEAQTSPKPHTPSSGSMYENSHSIFAEDNRPKIHILVFRVILFYSFITCIRNMRHAVIVFREAVAALIPRLE